MKCKILLFLCGFLILGACTTKEANETISHEELLTREAIRDCVADADAMTDGPNNSSNLFWNSYYTMCLKTRYGYSNSEIRSMR